MIEARGLEKVFKIKGKRGSKERDSSDPRDEGKIFRALRGVSFRCDKGMVLGLVGPNGAGKTTTLRILSTALTPTKGSIIIDGEDYSLFPNEIRRRIGFLSGTTGLYPRLTAREMVQYFGRLHGMEGKALNHRMDELFERFGMQEFVNERNDKLSTGMKQKVNIVRTLIHDPSIFIFDEPTTGLDIMSVTVFLDFLTESKHQNKTIIFSTHSLHEVETLCDQIVIINRGISSFAGTSAALKQEMGEKTLERAFAKQIEQRESMEGAA
ncbi:ABC transporter ATP-binding protein [Acanthopleuribacter pedis]|uniref:ATP-binding cassette domain-containing protein n=1 Tax=Acanthopleuribacter pedis TaxID=442870 RepID=A0A8J7U6Q7_9BACT|nr:ATP-binding cassette domain-containing protein [Acanthopleuribacter pedis]MBO1322184.1 ATP-binding cassette domain-containing protein [Acanthopleuribacter pedis]